MKPTKQDLIRWRREIYSTLAPVDKWEAGFKGREPDGGSKREIEWHKQSNERKLKIIEILNEKINKHI